MELEKDANILKPQIRLENTDAKGAITTRSVCLCKSYAPIMRSVQRQKRMYPQL